MGSADRARWMGTEADAVRARPRGETDGGRMEGNARLPCCCALAGSGGAGGGMTLGVACWVLSC